MKNIFTIFVIAFAFAIPSGVFAAELPSGVSERIFCGEYSLDIRGNGSGLMYQTAPIVPNGVTVVKINQAEKCAVVEWTTRIVSTSQVVFSETSKAPSLTNAMEVFARYEKSTPQNNEGTGFHRAILTGLESGKTYSYRVITRAFQTGLPHVDIERQIVVPAVPVAESAVEKALIALGDQPPVVSVVDLKVSPKVSYSIEKVTTSKSPELVLESGVVYDGVSMDDYNLSENVDVVETDISEPPLDVVSTSVSAINAVTAAISEKDGKTISTFLERFSRAFNFSNRNVSAEKTVMQKDVNKSRPDLFANWKMPGGALFENDRYIVPSIILLALLFAAQKWLEKSFGFVLAHPIEFWMFGVIAFAILAGILKFYYVTLIMVAIFLALSAWYVFDVLREEGITSTKKVID